MAANTVNTIRQDQSALTPSPLIRFTNSVAAYIKELEPMKKAVLMP